MLWDTGTWESVPGKDPSKTLVEGHLHFYLHGSGMKGEWLMVRLKPRGNERGENWLLRKVADAYVGGSDDLVGTMLTSVTTGRTMAEIAAGKPVPAAAPTTAKSAIAEAKAPGRKKRKAAVTNPPPPSFESVQLATLVDHVPAGSKWLHEMKYDGYRCLVAMAVGRRDPTHGRGWIGPTASAPWSAQPASSRPARR